MVRIGRIPRESISARENHFQVALALQKLLDFLDFFLV